MRCALLIFVALLHSQLILAAEPLVNVTEEPSRRAIVGAYYYPWYGVNSHPVEDDWQQVLRRKLVPTQQPQLGWYRSDDATVIGEHIKQSQQAGIAFWAVSWWGPDSATDRTFRESILKHPDAGKLRYAVLYESTNRLGSFDEPSYDSLTSDFQYMEDHYFDDPNYLRIDGRPVVFIYLTRVYFRDRGDGALAELRKKFPKFYLVGDDVFGPNYQAKWARNFDAITAYDVYGQSTKLHGATPKAIAALKLNYETARTAATSVGTAFMPAITPGYNDTAVRKGNPPSPRYLTDLKEQVEGSLFRSMIRDVAIPTLDETCGRIMMITSFNEWYEDTQIEPTRGDMPATAGDISPDGKRFTHGIRYQDYGDLYLDILSEELLDK